VSVSELASLVETNGDGDGDPLRAVARALLERNRQLEHALRSRILIEQAKGMLAERFSVEPDEAFELLRRTSRNHRMRVHDLAARVIAERGVTPPEIVETRR
jgi:AmiR/NasT family two-component response regulator